MTGGLETIVQSALRGIGVPEGARVVVGCSGGPDSMVLLHLLTRLKIEPVVAHVNYGLRGQASDRDQQIVESACRQSGIPVHVARADGEEVFGSGRSLQEAARDFRYAHFERVALTCESRFVAVAHHLDDQAETFLIGMLRDTSPERVAGMRASRPISRGSGVLLVRPLLEARRAAVLTYAHEQAVPYRLDASNEDQRFVRARARSQILPALIERFGVGIVEDMARTASSIAGYVDHGLAVGVRALFSSLARESDGGEPALDVAGLAAYSRHLRGRLIVEALRHWAPGVETTRRMVARIDGLLDAQTGRRVEAGGLLVWRNRGELVFERVDTFDPSPVRVDRGMPVELDGMVLRVDEVALPDTIAAGKGIEFLDRDQLRGDLIARPWRNGDTFRPLGMESRRKVSKYLTDQHVAAHRKSRVWVLCSGDEIVYVIGYGIADTARITANTSRVLRLHLETVKKKAIDAR